MKIWLVSDLHLDHERNYGKTFLDRIFPANRSKADTLVIAGDWCSTWNEDLTKDLFSRVSGLYEHVLAVPGNHEMWRTFRNPNVTPAMVNKALRKVESDCPNVTIFTEPAVYNIGGVRFLGGTMWYPNPSGLVGVDQDFVDFRAVKALRGWFFKQHAAFRTQLENSAPDVVISHHMPHPKSSDPQFAGSSQNHYFMQDMTETIKKVAPKLWLHGHGHFPADHVVEKTRVVVNPRGYPHEFKTRPPYTPKLIEV